ncbi:MAG: glycosyltransferase family 39 protein [Thermomicrobia bacterium]|nr:glycosyltransferase family 39 protein [Thermomicrobia bacterium]MCA1725335.1 glycosyltransferase family 39 protein [Thermomicrobia bacterium]
MHEVTLEPRVRDAAPDFRVRARWRARLRFLDRGFAVLAILYLCSLPFVAHRMTASDAIEYYVYDRSLYFDHDLNFTNDYQGFYDRNPKGLADFKAGFIEKRNPVGNAINNGPIGSALLWSPFFLAGDGVARLLHTFGSSVAADGYSQPYIWAVSLGSALYAGMALLLTYLLASAITDRRAAVWAAAVIWLGTPALFYSHLAPTYAHATSWFAAALFLTVWFRTRDGRSWRGWVALGALGGLVAMVREQDAVFLLVPVVDEALRLLPGVRHPDAVWWRDVGRTVAGGILMGTCAVLAFTPQLFVYRTLNGNFRPSSEVSDKLHWQAPNALRVLFDPGHGLFFWTPILLLAAVGLGLLIQRNPRLGIALATGFIMTWYLNGAFQTWTTAGAFGARRFIVCSPIFAVGLAALFQRYGERTCGTRTTLRLWVPIIAMLAILWNGGLILQFVRLDMNRQHLDWPLVLTNQFTTVPRHLVGDLWRMVRDPGSFYRGGGA